MRNLLLAPFAACLLLGTSAVAQSSADTVYHLHGTVVNGLTGKAIGRALVSSADRRLATMTNSEGNWTLDVSVPALAASADATGGSPPRGSLNGVGGGLILQAQRPGYLPFEEQTQVRLDAAASEATIPLRLMPASQVRGQVVVAEQLPARGMQVMLLRRSVMDGRYAWMQTAWRTVEPDGAFHFPNLAPGEYTVQLNASASRGAAPQQDAADEYPTVYLGETANLDAATRLRIGYGQVVQADLHPHPVPFYPVEIPMQSTGPNGGMNVRVLDRDGRTSGYFLRWNARDGRAVGSLPNGDYSVLMLGVGQIRGSATLPLHVAGAPLQTAAVTLAAMPDIPVHLRDERTRQTQASGDVGRAGSNSADQGFNLFVRPEDIAAGLPGGGISTRDGNQYVSGLPPGRYVVQGNAWRGYVASMSSGRTDLLRDPLVVAPSGADPIEITLRDDGGTVTGMVGVSGASSTVAIVHSMVMLVAADGVQRGSLLAMVQADGSFTIANVPPGNYRALQLPLAAMRNGGVPFRDAEAMRAYDERSTAVNVSAGQTTSVTLPAAAGEPVVQP